jgi:hypothetical protein
LPDLIRSRSDLFVAERDDALVYLEGAFMGRLGMLQSLPGMLSTGLMILFSAVLLGAAMGVRRQVMQFGRPLVILVVRSVVITRRHKL